MITLDKKTLDIDQGLAYLQGDVALFRELLTMFDATLKQLNLLAKTAQKEPISNLQSFYRSLHGSKPILMIVGSEEVKKSVEQICQAVALQDDKTTLSLLPAISSYLERMTAEVTFTCSQWSNPN
jgi:hypothetical protein